MMDLRVLTHLDASAPNQYRSPPRAVQRSRSCAPPGQGEAEDSLGRPVRHGPICVFCVHLRFNFSSLRHRYPTTPRGPTARGPAASQEASFSTANERKKTQWGPAARVAGTERDIDLRAQVAGPDAHPCRASMKSVEQPWLSTLCPTSKPAQHRAWMARPSPPGFWHRWRAPRGRNASGGPPTDPGIMPAGSWRRAHCSPGRRRLPRWLWRSALSNDAPLSPVEARLKMPPE